MQDMYPNPSDMFWGELHSESPPDPLAAWISETWIHTFLRNSLSIHVCGITLDFYGCHLEFNASGIVLLLFLPRNVDGLLRCGF